MSQWNYNNPSLNFPNSLVFNQPAPLPHNAPPNVPLCYRPPPICPSGYGMWNVPPPPPSNIIDMNQGFPPRHSFGPCGGTDSNVPLLSDCQQKWIRLCRQRAADQLFVDQFIKSRIPAKEQLPSTCMKICEFKELAYEAQTLISQLEKAREDSSRQWTAQDIDSLQPLRDRLNFVMEQINAPCVLKQMKEKVKKRKAKRDGMKRSKERRKKELKESKIRRKELDQQIDKRLEGIREKILTEKRDKETRKEADLVLSEVHRKQNEAKRLLELLESLKELRQLRASSVQSRHGLYATEEYNVRFSTVTEKASQLMKNQLALYDKEEDTLKAMMATHQEQKEEDEVKKQWDAFFKIHNQL